jgi:AraC family transcriptional regulator, transcriptional activator of pobA
MSLNKIFHIRSLSDWAGEENKQTAANLQVQTMEIIWTRAQGDQIFCYSNGKKCHPDHFLSQDGYYISFCPSGLSLSNEMTWQLFESDIPTSIVITTDGLIREKLFQIVTQLEIEQSSSTPGSMEAVSALLQLMIVFLNRKKMLDLPSPRYQPGASFVRRFFSLVELNFRDMKSVSAYARQMGVSPNYLNGYVKRLTGYPAKYHISKRLVIEAQRICESDQKSMKEIAYSLGFNDTSHFSKFFKRISGCTFMDFKAFLMGSSAILHEAKISDEN